MAYNYSPFRPSGVPGTPPSPADLSRLIDWVNLQLSRVAQATGASTSTATASVLAAGVVVPASVGLPVTIKAGESWHVQWVLWLQSGAAQTGGIKLSLAFPASSVVAATVRYQNSSAAAAAVVGQTTRTTSGTSLAIASTAVATFDSSTLAACITVDVILRNAGGAGTLDLSATLGTIGQNETILAGSAVIATPLS